MAALTRASSVLRWCATTLGLLAIVWLFTVSGRSWLHAFDREVLHERLTDGLAQFKSEEDWELAAPLRQTQDYLWWESERHPILIAHALGDSALPTANTIDAMHRAHRSGLRFFEVDISYEERELLCQHDPGARVPSLVGRCNLEALLEVLPTDSWLVLDIKTDFFNTGQKVVDVLRNRDVARRIIFQLYMPNHVAIFNRWQTQVPLPGPILTAYRSHRRITHVAAQMERIGAKVLTLPKERLVAMQSRPAGFALFLHPIHDCEAWRAALDAQAEGVYILGKLECAGMRKYGK